MKDNYQVEIVQYIVDNRLAEEPITALGPLRTLINFDLPLLLCWVLQPTSDHA